MQEKDIVALDSLERYEAQKAVADDDEARICEVCGKAMTSGYMCEDDYTYYCSDECLKTDLDNIYGGDNWFKTEEENSAGGYVTTGEDDLNIYWTDWED